MQVHHKINKAEKTSYLKKLPPTSISTQQVNKKSEQLLLVSETLLKIVSQYPVPAHCPAAKPQAT